MFVCKAVFGQRYEFVWKRAIDVHIDARYVELNVGKFYRTGDGVAVRQLGLKEELVLNVVRYGECGPGVSFVRRWVVIVSPIAGEVHGFTIMAIWLLNKCNKRSIVVEFDVVVELSSRICRAM